MNTPSEPAVNVDAKASSVPPCILVVDDHPDNRKLVCAFLNGLRCTVETADCGALAVSRFAAEHFDLVLMDVQMPEMTGYEATQAIRQLERDRGQTPVPILMLTALDGREDIARSHAAGANDHLLKPIRRATLIAALKRFLTDLDRPAGSAAP